MGLSVMEVTKSHDLNYFQSEGQQQLDFYDLARAVSEGKNITKQNQTELHIVDWLFPHISISVQLFLFYFSLVSRRQAKTWAK